MFDSSTGHSDDFGLLPRYLMQVTTSGLHRLKKSYLGQGIMSMEIVVNSIQT